MKTKANGTEELPDHLPILITDGEAYDPAMNITSQPDANAYFRLLVAHSMRKDGDLSREHAERIQRINLGHWAGYYSHATRLRVERLFKCEHPVHGKASRGKPTAEQQYQFGLALGNAIKNRRKR